MTNEPLNLPNPFAMIRQTCDLMKQTVETFANMMPFQYARPRGFSEIRDRLSGQRSMSGIEYPHLTIGPVEEVIIFDVMCRAILTVESETDAFFHVWGESVALNNKPISGGKFETVFPVKLADISDVTIWPARQGRPFNRPPVDGTHSDRGGFSKTNFTFSDGSQIVAVGPSIPKLMMLPDGAAQLWVTSVAIICDGTGRFAGAKGSFALNGSAYYPVAPDFTTPAGTKILQDEFDVRVSVNLKVVSSFRTSA